MNAFIWLMIDSVLFEQTLIRLDAHNDGNNKRINTWWNRQTNEIYDEHHRLAVAQSFWVYCSLSLYLFMVCHGCTSETAHMIRARSNRNVELIIRRNNKISICLRCRLGLELSKKSKNWNRDWVICFHIEPNVYAYFFLSFSRWTILR